MVNGIDRTTDRQLSFAKGIFRLLLLAAPVMLSSTAFATPQFFYDVVGSSFDSSDIETGCGSACPMNDMEDEGCGGLCHSLERRSNLQFSTPTTEIEHDTDQIEIMVENLGSGSFSYFYQFPESGGVRPAAFVSSPDMAVLPASFDISGLPDLDSFDIQFCIGRDATISDGPQARVFNCDALTITRDDEPEVGPPTVMQPPPGVQVPVNRPPIGPPVGPPGIAPPGIDPPVVDVPNITSIEPGLDLDMVVGESVTVTVNATVVGGHTLLYEGVSTDTDVVSIVSNDDGEYTVTAEGAGGASLTLGVEAVANGRVDATVNVTVTEPNRAPTAVDDEHVLASLDDAVVIAVLENDTDPDGDALSVSLDMAMSVQGAELSATSGGVTYTPPADFSEDDSFTYRATDDEGLESGLATVTVRATDTDGDGVFDFNDNCPVQSNTDQADLDSDNIGDLCDADPDGDGMPGVIGGDTPDGQAIVEMACLSCHNNAATGAPLFGDTAAWDARIAARTTVGLIDSAINGFGAMRAFGNEFTAEELTAAVLFLSGQQDRPDVDLDGIADTMDNCTTVANPDQADADGNGVGNVCEPLADNDADGYPLVLDDDDSNANLLPGQLNGNGSASGGVFYSSTALSLGAIAANHLQANGMSGGGVVMSETDFLAAANRLRPEVAHTLDSELSTTTGVFNFRAESTGAGMVEVRMRLAANIPLDPRLRVYDVAAGIWRGFLVSDGDSIATAAAVMNECPPGDSPNYSTGLNAGLTCVRMRMIDGGSNDSDSSANGAVELVASLGKHIDGSVTPPEDNGSSSGGSGGGSLQWPALLSLGLASLWRRRSSWGNA